MGQLGGGLGDCKKVWRMLPWQPPPQSGELLPGLLLREGKRKRLSVYGVCVCVRLVTLDSMMAPSFPKFLRVCQRFSFSPSRSALLNLHTLGTYHPGGTKCSPVCVSLGMGIGADKNRQ